MSIRWVLVLMGALVLQTCAMQTEATEPDHTPPGAEPHSADFEAKLVSALDAMPEDYVPRTELLRDDGSPRYINRLILEDSPYLLQHAHNPVNWYPWGDEAFDTARREGKPVLLSIGYSTCHWCHVMEKESFDTENIGRLLNEKFIAIKVDREQRPDVDNIYMTALQVTGKRGGWPMSSFLTPDAKPFFGGTYFPPDTFASLLEQVARAWTEQHDLILADAEKVSQAVRLATMAQGQAEELGSDAIDTATAQLLARHDDALGGFGAAPKFPNEPDLLLLLQVGRRGGNPDVLRAIDTTLHAMAGGGIYDQIGGGFHRYSTDARWLVPHFEKMLYNQAHLARVYTQAFLLNGDPEYRRVARETLDYVMREMTDSGGGFYSATDADSPDPERDGERHEGIFFLWTSDELAQLLSPAENALISEVYGVTPAGNFEGKTILNLPAPLTEVAARHQWSREQLLTRLAGPRNKMLAKRAEKAPPLRDDKILTSWNAMMITALCEAYDAFAEPRYLEAATRAAEFLWQNNHRDDGRLWRVSLGGSSSVEALQEDYAYLAEALVALFDASGNALWLERASTTADQMLQLFSDEAGGALYDSLADSVGPRIARPKSSNDGAIPAGNSVATRALARLYRRTGEASYRRDAVQILSGLAASVKNAPSAFTYLLLAADDLLHGEVGPRQYAADGRVKAHAVVVEGPVAEPAGESAQTKIAIEVRLAIAPGWHVNNDRPRQETLLPTLLSLKASGMTLEEVVYPAAIELSSTVQDDVVLAWRGEVTIAARVAVSADAPAPSRLPLSLAVQACDDRVCLQPETLSLDLPLGTQHERLPSQ